MTSEKGDFPPSYGNLEASVPSTPAHVDPIGEQNAASRDINSTAPHDPTGGGFSLTSGQVYAYDQSANPGISDYTPSPDNTTGAPPPYPGWGPPAPAGGHVYACDQTGMQTLVVVMRQPGPGIVHVHPDPGAEAEYNNLLITSIFLWLFCNWVMGIVGIVYVLKARNAAGLGLMDDAKKYTDCAKGWMVVSVLVGVLMIVFLAVSL